MPPEDDLTVFTADFTEDGQVEVVLRGFGPPGSIVQIVVLNDCDLTFVQNVQGDRYTFNVGEDEAGRYGLGCVDITGDGVRDLIGTTAVQVEGSSFDVERTEVVIDGVQARNGAMDNVTVPADDEAAVATLSNATCGDRALGGFGGPFGEDV